MTKRWNIIEKIIASLQIIFGLLKICIVFYSYHVMIKYSLNGSNLSWSDLSLYKIFKNNFPIFISALLFIVSGILLIKSNIKGWTIGLSMWLSFGIFALLNIAKFFKQNLSVWENLENLYIIFLTLFVFLIAIVMMSKEFRKKYEPNWKNWSMIFLIILAFTLFDFFKDKIPN